MEIYKNLRGNRRSGFALSGQSYLCWRKTKQWAWSGTRQCRWRCKTKSRELDSLRAVKPPQPTQRPSILEAVINKSSSDEKRTLGVSARCLQCWQVQWRPAVRGLTLALRDCDTYHLQGYADRGSADGTDVEMASTETRAWGGWLTTINSDQSVKYDKQRCLEFADIRTDLLQRTGHLPHIGRVPRQMGKPAERILWPRKSDVPRPQHGKSANHVPLHPTLLSSRKGQVAPTAGRLAANDNSRWPVSMINSDKNLCVEIYSLRYYKNYKYYSRTRSKITYWEPLSYLFLD